MVGGTSTLLGNQNQLEVVSMGAARGCNDVTAGSPSLQMSTTREGVSSYTYNVYFVGSKLGNVPKLEIVQEATAGHTTECGNVNKFIHSAGSVRDVKVHQVTEGGSPEVQTLTLAASDATASGGLYK